MLLTQVAMQGFVGGILSVVALVAALQRLSTQTAALLPTFTPAVAMMIAWVALGTKPETMELVGTLVIFLGSGLAEAAHSGLSGSMPDAAVAARNADIRSE
mgnify:CR=1 FL=1